MQSLRNLIPKDKSDIKTAEQLIGKNFEDLKPIIPDLLEWIQDMNWPVAKPVAEYLQSISTHLTPFITEIFRGNDSTWKYWCLIIFGNHSKIDPALLEEIHRLKKYASKMDIEGGVLEEVDKILNRYIERND